LSYRQMHMTPSAGTGGACFFRHAQAAGGFAQEGQMRPESMDTPAWNYPFISPTILLRSFSRATRPPICSRIRSMSSAVEGKG